MVCCHLCSMCTFSFIDSNPNSMQESRDGKDIFCWVDLEHKGIFFWRAEVQLACTHWFYCCAVIQC